MNIDKNLLKPLYNKCVNTKYTRVENDGDYAVERDGDTLYLYFQCSYTIIDWINNFDIAAVPYKDMEIEWQCHRGFLRVWKSIEPYVEAHILDKTVKKVIIVGYSHGAAIACLAHEYVWFHRPDLRAKLITYAFACPKFFKGRLTSELRPRWKNVILFKNRNDIVTFIPPTFLGYYHVANSVVFDSDIKNIFKAHTVDAYLSGIKNYVDNN